MSNPCASCGHALASHGRWWYDQAYGPCRNRRCYCQAWVEKPADHQHRPRIGEDDQVRCGYCGIPMRLKER